MKSAKDFQAYSEGFATKLDSLVEKDADGLSEGDRQRGWRKITVYSDKAGLQGLAEAITHVVERLES